MRERLRRRVVRSLSALVCVGAASLLVAHSASAQGAPRPEGVAITHVTVIDVEHGRRLPDRTVVMQGARIERVERSAQTRASDGSVVVDGRGRYLIPGLWDMHIHALTDRRFEVAFPLLLANGVTGIREMGSNLPPDTVNRIRRDVAGGRLLGPRFGALTYSILDGPGTKLYTAVAVTTADQGRELVRSYKQLGADFVKPYNLLPRDVYLAIVDEAGRQHLPVEGHVPFSMTAAEVSDLGQRTLEHNFDVLVSSSRSEAELRKATRATPALWGQFEAKAAATYDERKAKELYTRLARNGTWSCPTIVFYRPVILVGEDSALRGDSLMKYIPESLRDRWHTTFQRITRDLTLPEYRQIHYEMRSRIVGEMHRAGVHILAGTDAGAPYAVPGFSLHDELAALVDAGLTPAGALRAATIEPARFLRRERELGTIARGKLADVVLLDADPLADIHNTTRIRAVVANGRLLDRAALDSLLDTAVRAAAAPPPP